jgi:hypothetical protein
MEQIKAWPEEEQKHFMNNAYLVKPGTYSGWFDTRMMSRLSRVRGSLTCDQY